jgi:hypothetical protein
MPAGAVPLQSAAEFAALPAAATVAILRAVRLHWCTLLLSLLGACAGQPGSADPAALAPRAEPWPEADRLFHADPRWLGADAAFSVDLGGDRVLWLFGDTFVANSERHVRRESVMVRNSIAVQRGRDPSRASIQFCWRPDPSSLLPASWLPEDGLRWFWPQHGIRLPGGPLLLFWSRVRGTPGEGLGFCADGWIATAIDDPDLEPERWQPRPLALPPAPAGFVFAQGLTLYGDAVYGLAIREPGDHAGLLWRIDVGALRRLHLGAIELWCGGAWRRLAADLPCAPVLDDAAPEMSLHFDAARRCWMHVRSLGFGATTLALATAPQSTGPWSAPAPFYRPAESDRARPLVYAGKAHPELAGADLVATYAANSPDFAELVADDSLYWPRFVRVTFAGGGR